MALPIDTVPGSVLSGFGFALEEHGCLFEQLPVCDVINPSYSCVYKFGGLKAERRERRNRGYRGFKTGGF